MDIFELFSEGKVYVVGDLRGYSLAIPVHATNVEFTQDVGVNTMPRKTLKLECETGQGVKVTVIQGEVPEEILKTIRAWQRVTNSAKRKE